MNTLTSPGFSKKITASAAISTVILVAWLVLQLGYSRPPSLIESWNSWRQSDTQSIAISLLDDFDLLHPRVAWGGDGPGYVEAELQLYAAAIAVTMAVFGEAEWPGQLLSALFMALAGLVLFRTLRAYASTETAILGLLLFLSSRTIVALGVSVMPEALCLLAYTISLHYLRRYRDSGANMALVAMGIATLIAALIKPTALHLGAVQFATLLFGGSPLLRNRRIWFCWAGVLGISLAYLAYSHSLYLEWGNTFGVLGGADSKFPGFDQLFMPGIYLALAKVSLAWGIGFAGLAAALYLVIRRQLSAFDCALLLGNGLYLLVSLRYSSDEFKGAHYHCFGAVLAAFLVAHAVEDLLALVPGWRRATFVLCFAIAVARLTWALDLYKTNSSQEARSPLVQCSDTLADVVPEGELVVIRSGAPAWDEFWSRGNNFQDPRLFYALRTRGWSLASDQDGVDELPDWHNRGARFYLEPFAHDRSEGLDEWLNATAIQRLDCGQGNAFRLRIER